MRVLLRLRPNNQWGWFARQLRPFLRSHLLSVCLIVLSSLMFLLDPLLIKWLIDKVLPKRDVHMLLLAAGGFFGIYFFLLGVFAPSGIGGFPTLQQLRFPTPPHTFETIIL